jgi:hypothetical protein
VVVVVVVVCVCVRARSHVNVSVALLVERVVLCFHISANRLVTTGTVGERRLATGGRTQQRLALGRQRPDRLVTTCHNDIGVLHIAVARALVHHKVRNECHGQLDTNDAECQEAK